MVRQSHCKAQVNLGDALGSLTELDGIGGRSLLAIGYYVDYGATVCFSSQASFETYGGQQRLVPC
jgi:hypothetical protein